MMISEEDCWNILGDNFKNKGFVHHQTESFDNFINVGLPRILCEEPPIVITPDKETKNPTYKKYIISFSDVHIPSPTVIEEDRTLRGFLPSEARQRDLYYDSPIYVTITTTLEVEDRPPEIEKHNRVVIGRIPIMLHTNKCYLSNMTMKDRIKAGECEKDQGGYFIIKGKERVLIPQIRGVYNIPKVIEQKSGEKYKFIVETRSMSEETGHSALVKAMIGSDDRTLVFSIPYIKETIPIGVVFTALGYIKQDEIQDLIGLNCDKVEKYIRLILRDSFFCDEESDGFELFSENHKNNDKIEEIWKEMDKGDKEYWRNEMTRNNALKFIGKLSIHTLKESERINYAKQVVENELFPHMGITSTKKEKAYFLGYIVHKLLATSIGIRKEDDRDDYINKRVESAGVLCYELFRQLFKKYTSTIVTNMEKKKHISDAMSIIPRLPIITNGLRQCFPAGTLITMSNGLSIPIEKLSEIGGESVLGWNGRGFVSSIQTGLIKQGIKNTIKLTFDNGKTLICTPDHRILVMIDGSPKWIEAQNIPYNSRVISGIQYPEDDMELNDTWTLELNSHTFSIRDAENRNKTLAFVRMIGYIMSDGHICKDRKNGGGSVYLGGKIDVQNFIEDYKLVTGKTPTMRDRESENWGKIYHICLRNELTDIIRYIEGARIGKRTNQSSQLPTFILDPSCPVSVVREFLGGLFGGDGHCPRLDVRKGERTSISSVAFSWTVEKEYIDSLKNTFEDLCVLLEKVGVPNSHLNGPYNKNDKFSYRLHTQPTTDFSKKVGFRYCVHKQCKLTVASLYWEMEENIKRQHKFVSNKVSLLKENDKKITIKDALEIAREELKSKEYVLNYYYSLSSVRDISKRRESGRSPELKYLQKKYGVPDAEEYMNDMGVLKWFNGEYTNERDSTEIPFFTSRLLNIREDETQEVYDIGVNETHSFLAFGQAVHNCFSTGNWGLPKNLYIRAGVSQVLSRLSYGATLSNLRRVAIPVGKESKNAKIRQIHPSQIMFLCPSECFDPETPILMWDGTSKRAGDIVVGDLLVDDLGNATKVRSTCFGIKNMYDIIPDKDNFTTTRVTDNHILTLRIRRHKNIRKSARKNQNNSVFTHMVEFLNRDTLKMERKHFNSLGDAEDFVNTFHDDDTVDITIEKYLKLTKTTRDHLVLFKNDGINWEKKDVEMDPYLLGMWLGDGCKDGTGFALNYKTDHETLAYWNEWAEENGAVITKGERYSFSVVSKKNKEAYALKKCGRVEEAPLKKYLRMYNLLNNKHIPNEYLTNDRETRLKLLAGLIDTDGSVRAEGREIRICQGPANYKVVEDAYTVAMSLGFSCGVKEGQSQWTDEKSGEKKFSTYKELTITGSKIYEIPTLLPRKKLVKIDNNTQLLRSKAFMGSKFTLAKAGVGSYVGWQLEDPRGRFSLKCGLILHNTPEGQSIGIVLNLSLLTRISERFPTVLAKEVVEKCDNLVLIENYEDPNENTKVFLNGLLCGITYDPNGLVEEIKQFREIKMLPYDVSVSYDPIDDEINIYSDEGRLLRPVFTVEKNKLKITKDDGINWDKLLEQGLIKYVDNSEINNAVVAFNQNELGKYKCDYCEIAAAMMLGVMASIIPFPDHSQCIYKDEPVYMANGTSKRICDVEVGDEVITFHPETQQQSITKVSHTYTNQTDKQLFDIKTISGRKITATFDHRFMTYEGWLRIEHFDIEKTLLGVSLEPKPMSALTTDYVILSSEEFVKKCMTFGIHKNMAEQYLLELKHLLPLRSTNPNIHIISRLFGFILSDRVSKDFIVRISIDFDNEHDLKLFEDDVLRLGFSNTFSMNKKVVGNVCKLTYMGAFPSFFIALDCLYEKRTTDEYANLPTWIVYGSDLVKREFLSGFQGGDGKVIEYETSKQQLCIKKFSVVKTVSNTISQGVFNFMANIVELFKHFKINTTIDTVVKKGNITTISYNISSSRVNLITYFDTIGYRYNTYKSVNSGICVEYLKYLESCNIKNEIIDEINFYNDMAPKTIAEKLKMEAKKVYDILKYKNNKIRDGHGIITYNEWKDIIKCKSFTLFIPIYSKTKSMENIISDITTVSTNQSFLCGDAFCVHNSPRNCYQCLDPDTPVVMADNTQKAIKDVKIGDYVITVDPNTCKQSVTKVINQYVRETEKQIISIETESGRKITCTYDHPVLTSTGWKTADIAEDICVIPQQVIYEDGGCDLEIKYEHSLQKILIKRVVIPIFARMIGYFISCGNIKTNIKYSCYEFVFNSKNGLQDFIKDIITIEIDRKNFFINNRDNSSYHVIFINEGADLITSLLEDYTYKNIKIPNWIKNGSKLIKREFLAGFQGGSGGKLSITNDSFRLLDTSLIYITGNISILTKEIVELFEELGIKCGNARFSNSSQFVRLSFENTVENCINYFERIGWRYNNSNYNESLPVYEYCKKVIKDREDNAQIEESCWCFFSKKKVSIYEGYSKWKREVKDKAIFVKIVKRVKEEGNMIADITTESENHSFIAGDSFCVHNSAMGKQAMSMYALSHLVRSDTITHVLTYPQKPLVSTKSADMLGFSDMPSGMNTIVAVACYTGLTV